MTSPILLSAPDGTILAYACGRCFLVERGGTPIGILSKEKMVYRAQRDKAYAEQCCCCQTCTKPLVALVRYGYCEECEYKNHLEAEAREVEISAMQAEDAKRHQEALAKAKDIKAAEALYTMMSDLSERCTDCGWHTQTEYVLWDMLTQGAAIWGQAGVLEHEVTILVVLAGLAGGWWYWPGNDGLFITTEAWLAHLAERNTES